MTPRIDPSDPSPHSQRLMGPGFRKISTGTSKQSIVKSKKSSFLPPSPAENRFPLPIIQSLIKGCVDNARSSGFGLMLSKAKLKRREMYDVDTMHHCKDNCSEHEALWDGTMLSLSMVSRSFRAACWRHRVSKLIIKRRECFDTLEKMVHLGLRNAVRIIILHVNTPEQCVKGLIYQSLRPAFAERLNSFLASCPNLHRINDPNFAPPSRYDGASLSHANVREIDTAFPMFSFQGQMPLSRGMPLLRQLVLAEHGLELLSPKTKFNQKYFDRAFGGEMPTVKRLVIELQLPHEQHKGQFETLAANSQLGKLCSIFTGVEEILFSVHPPFITDPEYGCLIPVLFEALAVNQIPLQKLIIESQTFDREKLSEAAFAHEQSNRYIPFIELLPSKRAIENTIRRTGGRLPALKRFSFSHCEEMTFSKWMQVYACNITQDILEDGEVLEPLIDVTEEWVDESGLKMADAQSTQKLGPLGHAEAKARMDAMFGKGGGATTPSRSSGSKGSPSSAGKSAGSLTGAQRRKAARASQETIAGFPVNAFNAVVEYLVGDAQTAAHGKGSCSRECVEHDTPFSRDLLHLSMSCKAFRPPIWRQRIKRLLIPANEDFNKLNKVIKETCVDAIKDICLGPARDPSQDALNRVFCNSLKEFAARAKNLERYTDLNEVSNPNTVGPSFCHNRIHDVKIAFPCFSIQSVSLKKSFPLLDAVTLVDKSESIFGDSTKAVCWTNQDATEYLDLVVGDELGQVRTLTLEAPMSDEMSNGAWMKEAPYRLFKPIIVRFKRCQDLKIITSPPYTRDPSQAMMIPYLMEVLKANWIPLHRLDITTFGWKWEQFHRIRARAYRNRPSKLRLEELLPTSAELPLTLRNYSSHAEMFHTFTLTHRVVWDGKVIKPYHTVYTFTASEVDADGKFMGMMNCDKSHTDAKAFEKMDKRLALIEQDAENTWTLGAAFRAMPELYTYTSVGRSSADK